MVEYFERIVDEWRERAAELAVWTMTHMVNRTDVWGRYLPKKHRKVDDKGVRNNAITAPFRDERGKDFLGPSSLEKHFKTRSAGGVFPDLASELVGNVVFSCGHRLLTSARHLFICDSRWYRDMCRL